MRRQRPEAGMTLVEVLVACALAAAVATVAGTAWPAAVDQARVQQAAAYLSTQLEYARALALARSRAVGLYFGPVGQPVSVGVYADGNANGLRTAEVLSGIDPPLVPPRRIDHLFPGVRVAEGLQDGVRLGGTRLLTFSPAGTATPGSLYLTGRDGTRYAIRVSGGTARSRIQRFNAGSGLWSDR